MLHCREELGRKLQDYDEVKKKMCNKYLRQANSNPQSQLLIQDFTLLIEATPNNAERERLKHLMASSHNMTARGASEYRIHNLDKRAMKIVNSAK